MSIETGTRGELAIAERLTALGLPVEKTHHYAPYDLGVGGVRVEVKTCETPRELDGRRYAPFAVASRRRSPTGEPTFKNYGADSDFIVLFWAGDSKDPERIWVIPTAELPRSFAPRLNTNRRSRWDAFVGRFDLIQSAFEEGMGRRSIGEHVPKRKRTGRAAIPSVNRAPITPEEASEHRRLGALAGAETRRRRMDATITNARAALVSRGITAPSRRQIAKEAGVSMATVARWNREHKGQS